MVSVEPHAEKLERLYRQLNRREYVEPDPLQFLYEFQDPRDREIVALVASSLAYGRVAGILRAVSDVLERMMQEPARFLTDSTPGRLKRAMAGFKHRFSTGENVASMLAGAKRVIERYGSLGECYAKLDAACDGPTILPAMKAFVDELDGDDQCGHLLPDPARGSACKRLNLMLRWMVRRDAVDPGGWTGISPARLIVPIDTHMHKMGLALKLTRRRSPDMRTAIEITSAFAAIYPDDPVRYDFALTRLGIRRQMDPQSFVEYYWKEQDCKVDHA